MSASENFEATDESIYFVHNHTVAREKISLRLNYAFMENDTIPSNSSDYRPGQFVHYNWKDDQMFEWIVNGYGNKPYTESYYNF